MPRGRGSTCDGRSTAAMRARPTAARLAAAAATPRRARARPRRTASRDRARAARRRDSDCRRSGRSAPSRVAAAARLDAFTAITDAPPAARTSYTPGCSGGDSTTVAPSAKRSVIESVRAGAPRRVERERTTLSVGAPRRQRSGMPARKHAGVGHHGAPVAAARGEPVEQRAEEGTVGIGALAAAEAPAPESRRAEHRDAARRLPAGERHPALAARAGLARDQSLPLAARQRRRHAERRQAVEGQGGERRRERRRRRRGGEPLAFVGQAAARRAGAHLAWRSSARRRASCRRGGSRSARRGLRLRTSSSLDARERAVGAPCAGGHAIVGARRQRRDAAQRRHRLARVEVGR